MLNIYEFNVHVFPATQLDMTAILKENLGVIKLYTMCRHRIYFSSHLGAICAVQFYISTYLSFQRRHRGGTHRGASERRCDIEIHKFFFFLFLLSSSTAAASASQLTDCLACWLSMLNPQIILYIKDELLWYVNIT